MKHLWYSLFASLVLCWSISLHADTKTAGRLWNLQDADIISVINEVSLETGKNFVVDPRVTGKISLISSKPIKPNEVYDLFLSVLEMLGYSAISTNNVVKIVPNMESGEFATQVANAQSPGKGAEVVVRVIPLENIAAAQLIPIIRPFLPQWSNVSAYTPGNVLILLGRASNLERIVDIVHNVDQESNNSIDVIPLHQASAAQVATVLTNLQTAARATGDIPQISIAADERSNSILISGNKAARLRTRALIAHLDSPTTGNTGNTQVVYLKYLQAKNFAPILGKIAQNIAGKDKGSTTSASTTTQTNSTETKSQPAPPENNTVIQAEPSTNALIITAPPTLMTSLKNIISKLDIRPAQVLVEAIIVEINQDDLNDLGIQWGTNETDATITSAVSSLPAWVGRVGIIPHVQYRALLTALQNKSAANILSTPTIIVLDNQKASLSVGKQVSVQTGSYATTGNATTATPYTTNEYKDVVLKLDVTPQINLSNAIRLNVKLRNDSLQNPENPGVTPLINTNQINNSVIVDSDDMLVIGGLISNNISDDIQKVPLLGDIPVLGNLFTHTSRRLEKKNLMVFIKPSIMHTAEDASMLTNTKYNVTRQAQINWPQDLSQPGEQKRQNILPIWKNKVELPKPFET